MAWGSDALEWAREKFQYIPFWKNAIFILVISVGAYGFIVARNWFYAVRDFLGYITSPFTWLPFLRYETPEMKPGADTVFEKQKTGSEELVSSFWALFAIAPGLKLRLSFSGLVVFGCMATAAFVVLQIANLQNNALL